MSEKLTALIITLNEEKIIARCLEAVSQVADEIIVVDSFSSDGTEEICRAYGTKFYKHKFEGFIEQKEYARSLASHDLILSIEADEILSDELINSIKKVKANCQFKAYRINRLSYYINRFIYHGHWFPDKKVRLFRKESGTWGGQNPHDRFIPQQKGNIPVLRGVVYHYTFENISEHMSQAKKYAGIGASYLKNHSILFLFFKALLSPVWGFVNGYFFRLGFLDGWYGLTIARISSLESYLKYSKAIHLKRQPSVNTLSIMHLSAMSGWRGGEQQVVNLVEQLKANGVNNHLVVPRDSELARYCNKKRLPHTTISYFNGLNIFAAWRVKRLAKRLDTDIINMHCSASHTLGVISHILGNKAKLVLTRRVIFPIRSNTFSLKKYNYPGIERIICISQAVKDVLARQISRKNLFKVVYSSVDIEKVSAENNGISIRHEFQLNEKIIVAIIAALSPEKDHLTFLKSANLLLQSDKNFHFLVVGAGKEEENIKAYIFKHNLASNVTMTGFRSDIPSIMKESDYFVLTSTEEGLGSSIIEAFANKLPVVATRVGGIPELVMHENTGLLAEPGDAEEIARHILRMQHEPALRESLIENAYSFLEKNLRIEVTAKQTENIYREVLSEKG